MISPSSAWKLSGAEIFWDTEVFHHEIVQHSEPKFFRRKIVIFRSYSLFFDTSHLKIFETLDGSSRSFSVLWDKKNRRKTKIRMKVSEIPSFLKLSSGSQDFFANCETKFFGRKTWFSVLMHRKFRYPKFSGRLKALPTKIFSTVRPKKSK